MRRRPPPDEPDDRAERVRRLRELALDDPAALSALFDLDAVAGYGVALELSHPDRDRRGA